MFGDAKWPEEGEGKLVEREVWSALGALAGRRRWSKLRICPAKRENVREDDLETDMIGCPGQGK
jgi:hypothetical protein